MDYQIALAPELGLTSADFVQHWNASNEARAVAEARLTPSSTTSYDPLLVGAVAVLGSIGVGVTTNAIYDLIKQVVVKKAAHKHTHITQVDQPDGTHILVVDLEDE